MKKRQEHWEERDVRWNRSLDFLARFGDICIIIIQKTSRSLSALALVREIVSQATAGVSVPLVGVEMWRFNAFFMKLRAPIKFRWWIQLVHFTQ